MNYFKLVLFCCVFHISVAHADAYVYILPDGSRLITDKKINKKGYTLKKTYRTALFNKQKKASFRYTTIRSKYDPLIVQTALKHGLEPSFIKAIIHAESAFKQNAISHAGAMGLMQLMPGTAKRFNLTSDFFNAKKNIETGIQYVKFLKKRYQGDHKRILAAYNAGENAVEKYNGIPPYNETQVYVKRVLKLYQLYKKEI